MAVRVDVYLHILTLCMLAALAAGMFVLWQRSGVNALRLRLLQARHDELRKAARLFIGASRKTPADVCLTLDASVRALIPGIDAVLFLERAGGDLACLYATGARAEYFRGARLSLERDPSALTLSALECRRVASERSSGGAIPGDRSFIAVPLLDEGQCTAVFYAASSSRASLEPQDDLVTLVDLATPAYRVAVERQADREKATVDGLTGLLTPRALRAELASAFALASLHPDARLSLPTPNGENVVVRLLDHHVRLPSLAELGMPSGVRDAFCDVIGTSSGFVVVCGPTGSGKTTTLYAALAQLNATERAICTVEDPVEQTIAGITQVQVNPRAGVTFASVLRAHLRQDPDVIMVGEMRDGETANTAIAAALSGQLVFATLHSNDAPRAVERLVELGVARPSIAAGLSAVVAQRLVRRLCPHCKYAVNIDRTAALKYRLDRSAVYYEAGGCERCAGVGFRERVGLFEIIVLDDDLRDEISGGASSVRFAHLAQERGYRKLREDCIAKLSEGVTSVSEYARIAHVAGLL